MSDAKKEEKKEGEGEAAPPKSKKKLFIIIGVVLLLLGAGVPMFLMKGAVEEKEEDHEEVEQVKHYETAPLDTFIVNLSENATFLKVTMLIEYDAALIAAAEHGAEGGDGGGEGHSGGGEEKGGKLPALFEKRKPMLHDSIIRVLSSKKAADVISVEGKEQLKQELIEAINEALGLDDAPVVNVYFTEFIIQ